MGVCVAGEEDVIWEKELDSETEVTSLGTNKWTDCKRASRKEIALGDRDTSEPRRACLQPPACRLHPASRNHDTRESPQLPARDKCVPVPYRTCFPGPVHSLATQLPYPAIGSNQQLTRCDSAPESASRPSESARDPTSASARLPVQPELLFFGYTRRLHRSQPRFNVHCRRCHVRRRSPVSKTLANSPAQRNTNHGQGQGPRVPPTPVSKALRGQVRDVGPLLLSQHRSRPP